MAQVPRELTPGESALHFFGAELRHWRTLRGFSQDALGRLVLHSGDTIAKVEKAARCPSAQLAMRCDAALNTDGILARLWPLVRTGRTNRIDDAGSHHGDGTQSRPAPDTGPEGHDLDTAGGHVHRRSLWQLAVVAAAHAALPRDRPPPWGEVTPARNPTVPTQSGRERIPELGAIEAGVQACHTAYQRADYATASRLLPDVLIDAALCARESRGERQSRAHGADAAANIALSKLAAKLGDGASAWVAADRAMSAARAAAYAPLLAVAAYQVSVALLRLPHRLDDAENVAMSALDGLLGSADAGEPAGQSAGGALLLLGAVVAARRGDRAQSTNRLGRAASLARSQGVDQNYLWTGFGPTNVVIHQIAVAVELGQPRRALDLADHLDTSRLPPALVSRRAQVHLDLAAALIQTPGGDAPAVLHLLEAERMAPQALRFNRKVKVILDELLRRERRVATPGLRPLTQRVGMLG